MSTSISTPDYGVARFVCKSGTEWLREAASLPNPDPLYDSLWHSGEVACLFADTNMGKSLLAVQIGMNVARRTADTVLYFDFEMSLKQYQMRYTDPATGHFHDVPFNFKRIEFSQETVPDSLEELVADIEAIALRSNARHIIVDNITWLCSNLEEGKSAITLMQLLCGMKKRTGISMLVLAHTPKRPAGSPLTINSLGGSRHLSNFMDAVFALGRDFSQEGNAGRYVKQLKARLTEIKHGADNVIRYSLCRQGTMLGLMRIGYTTETEALAAAPGNAPSRDAEIVDRIRQMHDAGATQRAIAEAVGRSKGYVYNVLKQQQLQ